MKIEIDHVLMEIGIKLLIGIAIGAALRSIFA